ncbi:MAG TPA: hypothetical protein EYQ26_10410, partial [Rhodospirillales bacterium]|nr:hypothetical protein [Rhodospirillales bacterium]
MTNGYFIATSGDHFKSNQFDKFRGFGKGTFNGYKDFVLSRGVSAYISSGVGIAYGELDLAGGNTAIDG